MKSNIITIYLTISILNIFDNKLFNLAGKKVKKRNAVHLFYNFALKGKFCPPQNIM